MEVFYINICGFIGRGKFLYETRVLDSSYIRYKVQLPTSDSTEITAINQSINQRNFYSATYKKWTAALDNVNI